MITNANSRNTKNLLAGITPTFTNWTAEPGTLEDLVYEEYDRALTTPGTCDAGAKITYDIGSARRVIIFTCHQFADMITWASSDGVTWRQCTIGAVSAFAGVYRYFEIRNDAHPVVDWIKTIVYDI